LRSADDQARALHRRRRPRRPAGLRLGGLIFLCLFVGFTVTGSRERPWGDADHTYSVAKSIVVRGEISISYYWPPNSVRGADGKVYSISGLLQTLVNVPTELLLQLITYIWPDAHDFAWPLTSHLPAGLFGALLCVIFFNLCRRHGASTGAASLCTAMLAFGTMVWVYARYPYADIIQAACFLGFFNQVLVMEDTRTRRAALVLGLWAGLLINTKLVYVLSLAGAAGYLVWTLRADQPRMVKLLLWCLVSFLPLAALGGGYNHLRWGSPFLTGYELGLSSAYGEDIGAGLWGLFFSPGKSVFLYCPPLFLAALALPRFLRRHPRTVIAAAVMIVPCLLFISYLLYWPGGWCWGPRYILFAVPVLLLPLATLLGSDLVRRYRRTAAVALALTFAAGVGVQVVGNAFYWDHFIRIAKDARDQWLGNPDRRGAYRPERGRGHCDDCFEDMNHLVWLPPFSPIQGNRWLLWHKLAGDDWKTAEKEAPWHRYTTINVNIQDSYDRSRIDWWVLLWLEDHPDFLKAGLGLFVVLVIIFGWSAARWARAVRLSRPP
jgi:hypothetical protein